MEVARPCTFNRLREDAGRIIYLTPEQASKLVEAAKHDQNPHIHPFILIVLETSMRRMEILSIRIEHIDLDKRVIYIPKAKAGARDQPITQYIVDFLEVMLIWRKRKKSGCFHHLSPRLVMWSR